jgi:hypothetical protein
VKYQPCPQCVRANDRPDKYRCSRCAEEGVETSRARRRRLAEAGLCIDCGAPEAPDRRRCPGHLRAYADRAREYARRLKEEVFNAYGGPRCACCGESEPIMLSLDHEAQDGAARRRSGQDKTGTGFYAELKRRGFPGGFRVLCRNCNWSAYYSPDGRCPHHTGCFADPALPVRKGQDSPVAGAAPDALGT